MFPVSKHPFLSSNAQDFIEDTISTTYSPATRQFLSSNAQDFIEERSPTGEMARVHVFLSSNAQDFIEDCRWHSACMASRYS